MHVTGKKEPYLVFMQEPVIEIFSLHGSPPSSRSNPASSIPPGLSNTGRFFSAGGHNCRCLHMLVSIKKLEITISFALLGLTV
jgi:hypothetical protein